MRSRLLAGPPHCLYCHILEEVCGDPGSKGGGGGGGRGECGHPGGRMG